VGKPEGKRPPRKPRSRRRIIMPWMLEKQNGVVWTGFILLRIGTSGRLL
jgi:hypothetical protein